MTTQHTAVRQAAAERTAHLYERVASVLPWTDWMEFAPDVEAILELKRRRNAVVLAHNYQTPEIYHGVADITGDSLALARHAVDTDADVIVLAGVHFMAETAKIINPAKTVLIPDLEAGCSLASSITGADVRRLKAQYPGVPVVTYVNTSADVKAESDVCCTSGNALEVVEALGTDRVIFIPDEYLAKHVAEKTSVEVITWQGHCEVHERFTGEEIRSYREAYDDLIVLAHPECAPDVLHAADVVGSTALMQKYVRDLKQGRVLMLTECSMASNVSAEAPGVELVRPCNLCPHMNRITLAKIRRSLETMTHEVTVAPEVAERARRAVERMLEIKPV